MDSMTKNIIPICTITDENLTFTVPALFISIMETAKQSTFCKFYCFITKNVSQKDREKIIAVQEMYKNCTVELIDMGEKYLDSINRHATVTNACLYKFAIAPVLTQYDKILYLDTDIIVNEDLYEIYSTDLKDNYLAGVFNIYYYFYKKYLARLLNIPDLNSYINAGVMLMNTKLIRQNNLTKILEENIGKFQGSVDQHIFNKVCYGKILNIAPKYNVTLKYIEMYQQPEAKIFYTQKEIDETINAPAIIHYTGIRKPWNYEDLPLAGRWYSYYLKSPYKDIPLKREKFSKLIAPNHKNLFSQMVGYFSHFQSQIYKILNTKFNVSDNYRDYKQLFKYIKKQNSFPILIMLENLDDLVENRIVLKLIEKINSKFVVLSKKNGVLFDDFNTAKVKLFVFDYINKNILKTLKFYKIVILNNIESYATAGLLNENRYNFMWLLHDKNTIEDIVSQNESIQKIFNSTKNIIYSTEIDKIISVVGDKK